MIFLQTLYHFQMDVGHQRFYFRAWRVDVIGWYELIADKSVSVFIMVDKWQDREMDPLAMLWVLLLGGLSTRGHTPLIETRVWNAMNHNNWLTISRVEETNSVVHKLRAYVYNFFFLFVLTKITFLYSSYINK